MDWKNEKEMNGFKILVRAYYDYQRERLALDGRLGRTKAGDLKKGVPERDESFLLELENRRDELEELENRLGKEIAKHVHTHPLWEHFLLHVKGCGEGVAAVLLTEIDIEKAPTVSNIWSFAGLAPGKDRKKKGEKCPYNQFLRAKLCGVLGSSFLKSKSEYSIFYYDEKIRLENSDVKTGEVQKGGKVKEMMWKETTLGHRHKAATRKMVKQFIKDLYVAWRTIEGLDVRKPYEEEYLGRKHHDKGEQKRRCDQCGTPLLTTVHSGPGYYVCERCHSKMQEEKTEFRLVEAN